MVCLHRLAVALFFAGAPRVASVEAESQHTCGSLGTCDGPEEADESSALQIQRHVAASESNVSSDSGFVFTTSTIVAAVGTAAVGALATEGVKWAFDQVSGNEDFKAAVGNTGLPLTVAVINDTPHPVKYQKFKLYDGQAWGRPALRRSLKPGEMMEWFLYT